MNIKAINKVADAIESEAEVCIPEVIYNHMGDREKLTIGGTVNRRPTRLGFNMTAWCPYWGRTDRSGRGCGTVACIGGWTNVLYGECGEKEARERLGLSYYQANELFYAGHNSLEHSSLTAKRAVAVLRHLAETGEVNWEKFDKNGDPV